LEKLRVLDLFSGIGGFSLGLERTGGFETGAFCEIEPFPRAVLRKHWPDVPIHEDVRTLQGHEYGPIDVVCGGYPCQPFSNAGERRGTEDDRHLWPEVYRIVAAVRPTWCLFENVAGHITLGLDTVLSDLAAGGYAAQSLVVPACAVDAQHRRDRLWIVANPEHVWIQERRRGKDFGKEALGSSGICGDDGSCREQQAGAILADAGSSRQPGSGPYRNAGDPAPAGEGEATQPFDGCVEQVWCPEPDVGRVAHGVPNRVDRLKCLGNAVVPQIPEIIGRAILEAERAND